MNTDFMYLYTLLVTAKARNLLSKSFKFFSKELYGF
jgi:hypothetical protein